MGLSQKAGSMAQGNAEALAAGPRLLTGLPASSVPSLQAILDTSAFKCNPPMLCSKLACFSHFTLSRMLTVACLPLTGSHLTSFSIFRAH